MFCVYITRLSDIEAEAFFSDLKLFIQLRSPWINLSSFSTFQQPRLFQQFHLNLLMQHSRTSVRAEQKAVCGLCLHTQKIKATIWQFGFQAHSPGTEVSGKYMKAKDRRKEKNYGEASKSHCDSRPMRGVVFESTCREFWDVVIPFIKALHLLWLISNFCSVFH